MSNVFPITGKIPTVEDERPVFHLHGHVFKNPMKHCRPEHLWPTGIHEAEAEWVRMIAVYLANFAEPIRTIADEVKCPACDTQVTGANAILTDWRHTAKIKFDPTGTQEGSCVNCGYPCRLNHEIRLQPVNKLLVHLKNFPLFYHPSATEKGAGQG